MGFLTETLKRIRSENTKYRLVITSINLCVIFLLAFHHYYTNTNGMIMAKEIINHAIRTESSPPFKSISLKAACDADEKEYPIYSWPGMTRGCLCRMTPNQKSHNYNDYLFLDAGCTSKRQSLCVEKIRIEQQNSILLTKYPNGGYFCVKRYKQDEFLTSLNYSVNEDGTRNGEFDFSNFKDCKDGLLVRQDLPCPVSSFQLDGPEVINVTRIDDPNSNFTSVYHFGYSLNGPKCRNEYGRPERIMPSYQEKDYMYLASKNIGCKLDSFFEDSVKLSATLENQLYEINNVYQDMVKKNPMYDYYINSAGNRMNFYSYHSLGFMSVRSGDLTKDDLQIDSAE